MRQPWVLLPAGPPAWSSYNAIFPELIRIWEELGCHFEKVWYPGPKISADTIHKLKSNASCLVLPIGIAHWNSLGLLRELRQKHQVNQRAIIMVSSDLTVGLMPLADSKDVIRPNDLLITNCSADLRMLDYAFSSHPHAIAIPLPVGKSFSPVSAKQRLILRKKLGVSADERILLYSGRISAQKNLHSVLICLRHIKKVFPKIRLFIAGSPDELGYLRVPHKRPKRYIHELCEMVVRLGLEAHVEFLGEQSQEKLLELMRACDLHLSLTLHSGEDFGYSIAQGLSVGAATLVTKWGGGCDFIKHSGAQGVPVHVTENGPKIHFQIAIQQMSKLLIASNRALNRPNYLRDKFISARWARVFKRAREDAPLEVSPLFKSILLRRRTREFREHGWVFPSASDSGYRKILSIYSEGFCTSQTKRYYWNPLFDPVLSMLWDPLCGERQWKFTESEREFIRRHISLLSIEKSKLSIPDRKTMETLVRRAVLLNFGLS